MNTAAERQIVINGKAVATQARTLAELLVERELSGEGFATAINGRFVARVERANTVIAAGDRVEIVSPRQGG